jgi:hypothetical protein
MERMIDLHSQAARAAVAFLFFRQSSNWFAALDRNHDGRLSRQELRNAWNSLTALQESPGEFIAAPENRQNLHLEIHLGANSYFGRASLTYLNPQAPKPPTEGPIWFRKMDRNSDGVVSRREFLGPKEQFNRIDANGDGLVDLNEAERANQKK